MSRLGEMKIQYYICYLDLLLLKTTMGVVLSFVCSEIKVIGIMLSVSFEKPWRMKRTILIRPYIAYCQTEQGLNGRLNSSDILLLDAWCRLSLFRRADHIISYVMQLLSKLSEVSEAQ